MVEDVGKGQRMITYGIEGHGLPAEEMTFPRRVIFFLSFAYVFMFAYVGFFAFPWADDYVYLGLFKEKGFWGSQYECIFSQTARYTNNFYLALVSSFDKFGLYFQIYRLIPFLSILLSYYAIFFCIRSIFPSLGRASAFSFSLLLQALWLSQMPTLNDSLYMAAGVPYYATLCLILFAVGWIGRLMRGKHSVAAAVMLSLIAFLNSGLNEIGAIFLFTLLLFVFILYVYQKNYEKSILMLAPIIFCLLGLVLVYFAPATEGRFRTMPYFLRREARNLYVTLSMTIIGGIPFSIDVLLSPLKYVFLLFLPDILPYMDKNITFANPLGERLKIRHAIFLTIIGAFGFEAITAFALASPLPLRGEMVASWALWFCWIMYFLFFYRDKMVISKIKLSRFYRWRYALVLLCFLASFSTRTAVMSIATADDFYSRRMERRAIILSASPDEIAYVPIISGHNASLFLDDSVGHKTGNEDGSSWVNEVMARCYGVKEIYGIPSALYDMGVRGEFSDEEYLDALKLASSNGDAYASFLLARIYDVGRLGLAPDVDKAAEYYEDAFRGGENRAVRSLFRIYLADKRLPRNYEKAMQYGLKYMLHKYVLGDLR
jgi:hypothetical protein